MESPPDHRPRLGFSEAGGEGTGLPWWASGEKSRLPTQGTRVRSLFREEPVCHAATERLHHDYGRRRALAHAQRRPTAATQGRAQQ